ncbi:LacI family DNA-binding transcriptional regulator [Ruania alkalisoli]|uniref:LacI family DNA-binding transcriptional regulator n=1 Tax=Ruania alkalisoli TaxID=2779775 RepID=A0A7M1SVJ0_9MICO|nr:LacI family DNA-binding transcriptional regulator [Ruania alkalisoli]QOR71606.1 LacI family DNA-binding transcriptional regulator [Ruania alkalisoli]
MAARKNVTLSDVAAAAGVSLSTASKALNGGGRIGEVTRLRVVETAERLDFRPNALAQSFALGRSRTVGLLTQNAVGTWSGPILVGATSFLGRHEQAALHYDAHFDIATLNANVRKLLARRIDGLLILGEGPEHVLRSVTQDFSVPVAYAFASTDDSGDAIFMPDGEMIGRVAAEHLLEIGRRKIAHIGVDINAPATERTRGFHEAMAAAGVQVAGEQTSGGDWKAEWGEQAMLRLLEEGVDFDGLFCANDVIAEAAEKVLLARGLSVPDDVAIVGVDNWEGVVARRRSHLTTVDPQLAAVGAAAAEYVVEGRNDPGVHRLPVSLVVGASSVA